MNDQAAMQPVRETARVNVSYREYVNDYAKMIGLCLFVLFCGVGLIVGSVMTLEGPLMGLFASVGLAMTAGGGGSMLAAMTAHDAYTRHLATTRTKTYQPAEERPTEGGRAFIPSTNGAGRTVHVGAHWLTPELWRALEATANRDGRITRDGAIKALPRRLYRNWSETIGELVRLGLVDSTGLITPLGKQGLPPYPNSDGRENGGHSTHARRTHGEGRQ